MSDTQSLPVPSNAAEAIEQLREVHAMRLLIPDTRVDSELWSPHQHGPAVVMTRHRVKTHDEKSVAELVLGAYIDTTGLDPHDMINVDLAADIYHVTYKGVGLIVKMLDTAEHASRKRNFIAESKNFERARSVQGTSLPRLAGLFEAGPLQCLIFEPAGRELKERQYKDETIKAKAVECMEAILATGVVPIPFERHWYRMGDDGLIKRTTLYESLTRDFFVKENARLGNPPDAPTPEESMEEQKRVFLERLRKEFR